MTARSNIDLVPDVAGRVVIFGAEHDVRDLDGDDYRLLNGEGTPNILAMYELIQKLVPTLGADAYKLTGKKIAAIIAVADGRIKDVEAEFPNGPGPETNTPASPA